MKGGHVPEHWMLSLDNDEGDRLHDLLEQIRELDKQKDPYRLNLNEAEDELLEAIVERTARRG